MAIPVDFVDASVLEVRRLSQLTPQPEPTVGYRKDDLLGKRSESIYLRTDIDFTHAT